MRRLFRRALLFAALVALAAGTSGDVAVISKRFDGNRAFAAGPTATSTSSTPPPTTTTTEPPPVEWAVYAGGDVLMDRSETAGRDPFASLVPPLADADLALVNVEMAIAESGAPQAGKEFTFRAPPSAALTMAAAGVDAGNLGNNHARDFGTDALLETIGHLRAADVAPVGAGASADEAYRPATFTVGKGGRAVSVAVLGSSDNVPGGWAAEAGAGIATTRGEPLLEAVRAAAEHHDVVLVMVHWGVEGAPCPNEHQIAIGDSLIEAGATAVIGSHPHVLQPIVQRGEGLVAYSLGNFVWHSRSGPQGETGILELRFIGPHFDGFSFHPHVLGDTGDPEPANAEATRRIEGAVSDHCTPGASSAAGASTTAPPR